MPWPHARGALPSSSAFCPCWPSASLLAQSGGLWWRRFSDINSRMSCPIGLNVLATCARKRPDKDPCSSCRESLEERAAILEFGQGTGGSPERPTCSSREAADALALEQARASLPGQRTLV